MDRHGQRFHIDDGVVLIKRTGERRSAFGLILEAQDGLYPLILMMGAS